MWMSYVSGIRMSGVTSLDPLSCHRLSCLEKSLPDTCSYGCPLRQSRRTYTVRPLPGTPDLSVLPRLQTLRNVEDNRVESEVEVNDLSSAVD